jgi:serine/threonine-protein kinase
MEYIDGEDLGSLLRRIGKLPAEKALELTREICLGIAAAHGLGVVHRDLKPANIMIDGHGRARVTDFGLAALEHELRDRVEFAGTPAYMAPEQASGQPATPRSDLYSLGLILYEMFTGRRASEVRPASRGARERSQSHSTITAHTNDLDPAVQRVILRCLEVEPESRPPSIHAVIAALPGGDPLQAALEAGETPSPEMIAAAGATGELPARMAVPLFLLAVALLFTSLALYSRSRLISIVPMPKKPDALADRARELATQLGYTDAPADVWSSFGTSATPIGRWLRENDRPVLTELPTIKPNAIRFYYRSSPRELTPLRDRYPGTFVDPPFDIPGMVRIAFDGEGRLVSFEAVPEARSSMPPTQADFDWRPLLGAAGFDLQTLRSVPAEWAAATDTDRKVAWEGTLTGQPEIPARAEAALYRGKPVSFLVKMPWTIPVEGPAPAPTLLARISKIALPAVLLAAVAGGGYLVRRNVRRGRADRAGAFRLALFTFVCVMLANVLLIANHSADLATEVDRVLIPATGDALFKAGLTCLFYLALEPYLRRRWPHTLIGWSRLLAGRAGDPLVARDVLTGFIGGAAIAMGAATIALISRYATSPALVALDNPVRILGMFFDLTAIWTQNALGVCMVLLLTHIVTRNRTAAVATTIAVVAMVWVSPGLNVAAEVVYRLYCAAIVVGILVRFGVLAGAVTVVISAVITASPVVLDPTRWYFASSVVILAALILLAGYAAFRSLGAQALFTRAVLDD